MTNTEKTLVESAKALTEAVSGLLESSQTLYGGPLEALRAPQAEPAQLCPALKARLAQSLLALSEVSKQLNALK